MITYKGYTGKIEYVQDEGLFHGEVLGTQDVITFQGKCGDELEQSFQESIDDYLAFCRERDEMPDRPFSGKFVLRLSPEMHRQLFMQAGNAGKSLNSWIADLLAQHLGDSQNAPGSD